MGVRKCRSKAEKAFTGDDGFNGNFLNHERHEGKAKTRKEARAPALENADLEIEKDSRSGFLRF